MVPLLPDPRTLRSILRQTAIMSGSVPGSLNLSQILRLRFGRADLHLQIYEIVVGRCISEGLVGGRLCLNGCLIVAAAWSAPLQVDGLVGMN